LIAIPRAKAITLDFSNLVGTEVDFSGGVGDSINDKGYLTPGSPFAIATNATLGGVESAPVTGSATLHITDNAVTDLTGLIPWVGIEALGAGGTINLMGTLNLTGITYGGAGGDLSALVAAGNASDVVTFQFMTAETLTDLKPIGGETSHSGTILAVPEPGPFVLVIAGLAGLLASGLQPQVVGLVSR